MRHIYRVTVSKSLEIARAQWHDKGKNLYLPQSTLPIAQNWNTTNPIFQERLEPSTAKAYHAMLTLDEAPPVLPEWRSWHTGKTTRVIELF